MELSENMKQLLKSYRFGRQLFANDSTINYSDLKCIDTKDFPLAVTMTDTFCTNLSKSEGLTSRYIHLCTDREMVDKMISYAESRGDTKHINWHYTKNISSSLFTDSTVSLKTPKRLIAWTEDYKHYYPEKYEKACSLENPLDNIMLVALTELPTRKELISEINRYKEKQGNSSYYTAVIEHLEKNVSTLDELKLTKEDFNSIFKAVYLKKLNGSSKSLPKIEAVAAKALRPFSSLKENVEIVKTEKEFNNLISSLAKEVCQKQGIKYIIPTKEIKKPAKERDDGYSR